MADPGDKLTIPQFAAKIKAKYPDYKDVEDTMLVQRIVQKYPDYASQVDMGGTVKKKDLSPVSPTGSKTTTPNTSLSKDDYEKSLWANVSTSTTKPQEMPGVKEAPEAADDDIVGKALKPLKDKYTKTLNTYNSLAPGQFAVSESTGQRIKDNLPKKVGEMDRESVTAKTKRELNNAVRDVEDTHEAIKRTIFPTAEKANEYLSTRKELKKENATDQMAVQRLEEYKERADELASGDILKGAVEAARKNSPAFNKQYTELEKGGLPIDKSLPQATLGRIVDEYLQDPNVKEASQKNPQLRDQYYNLKTHLLEQFPEYGAIVVGNEMSRQREKEGKNNAIANVIIGGSEYMDKLAEKMYANNPQKLKLYNEVIKKDFNKYIDTPGFFDKFEGAVERSYGGTKKSVRELLGQVGNQEGIYEGLKEQGELVDSGATGGHEISSIMGDMTGLVSYIAATGGVMKGLGAPAALADKTSVGLTFFGDEKSRARMKFPNDPWKQKTAAGLNTLAFMTMNNIFPAKKVQAALGEIRPIVADVTSQLANGTITREAAKSTLMNALEKTVAGGKEFAKQEIKGASEMTALAAANQGLDKALGLQQSEFDEFHHEGELADTFKSMLIGNAPTSLLIGAGAARSRPMIKDALFEMATNPRRYENQMMMQANVRPEAIADVEQRINNLGHLTKVKSELDAANVPTKQQKSYLLHAVNERALTAQAEATIDPTIKGKLQEQIKKSQQAKESILKGKDVDVLPQEDNLTAKEQKAVSEISNDQELFDHFVKENKPGFATTLKGAADMENPKEGVKMGLEYMAEKAAENPKRFAEVFGNEMTERMLDRVETKKLEEILDSLLDTDADNSAVPILDKLIEKRHEKEGNVSEPAKEEIITDETIDTNSGQTNEVGKRTESVEDTTSALEELVGKTKESWWDKYGTIKGKTILGDLAEKAIDKNPETNGFKEHVGEKAYNELIKEGKLDKVNQRYIDLNKEKMIAEAYHKAKKNGSNPELVSDIEFLLEQPTKTIKPKEEGGIPKAEGPLLSYFRSLKKDSAFDELVSIGDKMGIGVKEYDSDSPLAANFNGESVTVNKKYGKPTTNVVAHEVIHGILHKLTSNKYKGSSLDLKLNKFKGELFSYIDKEGIENLNLKPELKRLYLDYIRKSENTQEIVTFAFTNEQFHEFLSSIKVDGAIGTKSETLWGKLKNIFKSALKELGVKTKLDELVDLLDSEVPLSLKEKIKNNKYAIQKSSPTSVDVRSEATDGGKVVEGNAKPEVITQEGKGEGEKIGITHRQMDEVAKELGMPTYEKHPETVAEWDATASKRIANNPKAIPDLLNKMRDGVQPDAVEQRMMVQYIADLKAKINKTPTDALLTEMKRAKDLSNIVGGREVAKSLVARKGERDVVETIADALVDKMDRLGVEKLTEKQKEETTKLFVEDQQATKAYEEKIAKLEEENAKLRSEAEVKKMAASRPKTKRTHEEYAQERKDAVKAAREALLKVAKGGGGAMSSIPGAAQLVAIAPHVKKIVESYVAEGVDKLGELVKKVHSEIKDLGVSEKDIHNIIAGVYNEKKATQRDLAIRMRDLQTEAKLINRLEELEAGAEPKSEKKKQARNKEIADLTKEIKEHDLTKLAERKTRLAEQIKKVEEQIKNRDFEPEQKKTELKLDKEAIELENKLIEVRNRKAYEKLKDYYQNQSNWEKGVRHTSNILNVPRSLMSSMDFSAILRQGVIPAVSHPVMATKAAKEMFSSAFSQKKYDRWFFDLQKSERFKQMNESGLALTDSTDPHLQAREELFMSNLAEKIPIAGSLVKGSERAYSMFLNKMRVDLYNRFADAMEKSGKTIQNSPEQYKEMAKYVNNSTGRGSVSKSIEPIIPLMNSLFFSPRLIASRINMLTYLVQPRFYKTVPAEVRKAYFKDMASFISVGLTVLALAKLNGADVEDDPRSSDFGKIKSGNTRWDIWGGFQPYVRAFEQVRTGQRKSTTTGKIYELDGKSIFGQSRGDVLKNFFRGKLAPVPSMTVDMLSGRTMVGDRIVYDWEGGAKEKGVSDVLKEHLLPMTITGMEEALKDQGTKALFTVGVPSLFGIGTQSYEAKKK